MRAKSEFGPGAVPISFATSRSTSPSIGAPPPRPTDAARPPPFVLDSRIHRDLRTFIELAGNRRDIVLVVDRNGTLHGVSDSAETILGHRVADNLGRNIIDFVHPADVTLAVDILRHALERAGQYETIEVRVRCADGTHLPFEILPKNMLATHGVVVLTGRNVTDRHRLEAERRRSEVEFRLIATAAPVAMFRIDGQGRCQFMNDHWTALSHQPVAEAMGLGYLKVVARPDRALLTHVLRTKNRGGSSEITINGVDGVQRTTVARWTALGGDGSVTGWVGTLEDISAHRALEARLSHQARHDPLTGLPNRMVINDHLSKAIAGCAGFEASFAVLFIDLDQFKFLNDSLGHEAGDRLLVAVADRLRIAVRPGDVVGRFGGDEFVAILADVTTAAECEAFADRIAATLAEPFEIGTPQPYTCTASIGIAHYAPGATAESLLRHADAAMYRAKATGRDRVAHYIPEMQRSARERLSLEMDLRNAIGRDELALLYQPIIATATGRIDAVEALVRWDHPERGRLLPDVFIPIAEQSGLISQLGDWVLRQACCDLRHDNVALNVNLSGRQIQDPDLARRVAAVLADERFPPARLTLEITESVLMHDADATAETLSELKALGVALAVDDFGTGYASLNYLSRFPVDCLKVDRSFVSALSGGASTGGGDEIARAVVNLAHSLGMAATAEGVEREDQLATLLDLGCELVQGYLFAHPLPLAELRERLRSDLETPGLAH